MDGEKSKLLSEISRLTAQILLREESITYLDTQLYELRKENENLKKEVQTIPVLNAQVKQNIIYILFVKNYFPFIDIINRKYS